MTKSNPLTVRELELWKEFLPARGLDARNALALNYQPFVQMVAARLRSRVHPTERDELVNDGQPGLLSAIDGFNLELGKKFTSFARPRVRGAMLDAIRLRSPLSVGGHQWKRRIDQAHADATRRTQAPANASEVAGELGLSDAALAALHRSFCLTTRSLSDPVLEQSTGKVIDLASVLPDPREETAGNRLQRQMLWTEIVQMLDHTQCRILELRYHEDRSFAQIGEALGVAECTAWQAHKTVIAKLRSAFQGRADEFV